MKRSSPGRSARNLVMMRANRIWPSHTYQKAQINTPITVLTTKTSSGHLLQPPIPPISKAIGLQSSTNSLTWISQTEFTWTSDDLTQTFTLNNKSLKIQIQHLPSTSSTTNLLSLTNKLDTHAVLVRIRIRLFMNRSNFTRIMNFRDPLPWTSLTFKGTITQWFRTIIDHHPYPSNKKDRLRLIMKIQPFKDIAANHSLIPVEKIFRTPISSFSPRKWV